MWGKDFIFMDGFEIPSGLWNIGPDPSDYIDTPWGKGFDGSKTLYRYFDDALWNSEFWIGFHIKPRGLDAGSGATRAIVDFRSDYAYLSTRYPVINPMLLTIAMSGSGTLRVDYLASKGLFASSGYMIGAETFEADQWNHFMAKAQISPIYIGDDTFIRFYTSVYKNNNLVFEDESAILSPYTGFAGVTSFLKWDGFRIAPTTGIYQYDNVWVSHNGPKGDLIANN